MEIRRKKNGIQVTIVPRYGCQSPPIGVPYKDDGDRKGNHVLALSLSVSLSLSLLSLFSRSNNKSKPPFNRVCVCNRVLFNNDE